MLSYATFKEKLKQIPLLCSANAALKSAKVKRTYEKVQKDYEKLALQKAIIYDESTIPDQVKIREGKLGSHNPRLKGELRILYVGTDAEQDFGGIIQGLLKFGEVILFEHKPGKYGQQLYSDKRENVPEINGARLLEIVNGSGSIDAIIGQMWAFTMDGDSLKKVRHVGVPVINLAMDDRHTFYRNKVNGRWTGTAGLIGAIDLVCTAAKECCLWYQVEGSPSIYLPEASNPELYKPLAAPKEHDVCFVGANYGIRSKIIKAIEKKGIKVSCYGKGWPTGRIDVEKMPELFAKSRIVLGVGTIGHCTDLFALKMRDFDGPMSGSLYITHDNPDLHDLYDINKEIITYKSPEDCAEKIEYYLKHVDERETIAAAGRIRAEKEHTWENRFDKVLRTMGLIDNKQFHNINV
jgi:hypothetical protein